ncbi:MAG: hypothetical protein L3J91_07080 [Thermoplasmata archaeon]|nr:hypothetical protein [Thermoplasmata archaeon]
MEPIQPFTAADPTAMRWIRPEAERHAYELRAGDALLARVVWAHSVGSLAHVSLAGAELSLKRGGFLQPHVTLRDASGADLGRLAMHFQHGTMTLSGGRGFLFRRAGIFVPAWQISDAQQRPLVHIEPVADRARLQGGIVQVDPGFAQDPALATLVVMGWYFIVLAWFEDETLRASESVLSAASG